MDTQPTTGARGATSKRKAGRPRKGPYRMFSIRARMDIADSLERLAGNGITRTDLFEAAAAIALRDEGALLDEVRAQRNKADALPQATAGDPTSSTEEGRDVAA